MCHPSIRVNMLPERYKLKNHVHLCITGGYVVMLDVRYNKYRAITARRAAQLCPLVPGWPAPAPGPDTGSESTPDDAFAKQLVREGILSADLEAGKDATPVVVRNGVSDLVSAGSRRPRLSLGSLLAFMVAAVTVAWWLKRYPFERIVHRAGELRSNALGRKRTVTIDQYKVLIARFRRLQPFFFTSRNACLFESLVLLHYLSLQGAEADWVFGVRMKPWGAHCWLQLGSVVLSDTLEHTGLFTPIMVI